MSWKQFFGWCLVVLTVPAAAVEIKAGQWKIDIGGTVNSYYSQTRCTGTLVQSPGVYQTPGGIEQYVCNQDGEQRTISISNGFLPNGVTVAASTTQNGLDIGAVIGLYLLSSSMGDQGARSTWAPNHNSDIRQAYLTFGNKDSGTFKMGRDYGLFGLNAMINSPNTIALGVVSHADQESRMALGNVGVGTVYPGNNNAMSYTTPTINGFSATASLNAPVVPEIPPGFSYKRRPGLSAQFEYTNEGLKLWTGFTRQKVSAVTIATNQIISTSVVAYEIGGSYNVDNGWGVLLNYQYGQGLGLITVFDTVFLDKEKGWQQPSVANLLTSLSYKYGQTKFAYTWGRTRCISPIPGQASLKQNAAHILGLYYAVKQNLTIAGEWHRFTTVNALNQTGQSSGFALGAILFF